MASKFDEFGGWLKFFYFLCLLNIVTSLTMLFMLGGEIFGETSRPIIEIMLEALQVGVTLFLLYLIIQVIQIREPNVPEYIKDKLFLMFIVALAYFAVHSLLTIPGSGWQMKNTMALAGSVQSMLWATIWRTYFERSERVEVYYHPQQDEHIPDRVNSQS